MDNQNKKHPGYIGHYLLIGFVFFITIFVIWGVWKAAFPPIPPMQGQMEARIISVSSRVPGRVLDVLVKEGDFVKKDQPVATMYLPELDARLSQAKALENAAMAEQSLVDAGARPQEKEAAKAEWERAKAEADLAIKTMQRIGALFNDGLISRQKYDESRAQMLAATNQAKAARMSYEISLRGARPQEKEAAADKTDEAAAGVAAVEALTADHKLLAPHEGQVEQVILVSGEMAGAGFPIITLVNIQDQWATFNIREDNMPGIEIGSELVGHIPAIGKESIVFSIYYISPRASYATWRSTRENSGYDMKTFEVRARPLKPVPNLRPGMSVLVER